MEKGLIYEVDIIEIEISASSDQDELECFSHKKAGQDALEQP